MSLSLTIAKARKYNPQSVSPIKLQPCPKWEMKSQKGPKMVLISLKHSSPKGQIPPNLQLLIWIFLLHVTIPPLRAKLLKDVKGRIRMFVMKMSNLKRQKRYSKSTPKDRILIEQGLGLLASKDLPTFFQNKFKRQMMKA